MTAFRRSDHSRTMSGIGTAALLCSAVVACSSAGAKAAPASLPSAPTATSAHQLPAPAAAAGTTHPCALLTRAEAETAVGQPLTGETENPVLGNCSYASADFAAGVDITVSSWDAITNAAHGDGHTPPAVGGIGDGAFFGVGLSVRKGTQGFLLLMNGPNIDSLPDHGLAKEKALAAIILPRL